MCFSSQSFSTSDAAAEAAVFCHTYTEPREAAAAGPPPAQALQLHPQSVQHQQQWQHHTSSSHPETRPLWLPPRSDGKRWSLTFRKERRHTWECRGWLETVKDIGRFVNDSIFMFLGVLCALYVKQEAPPHPPLHPADEAQPRPLFHQLQRDCTQVGEHNTRWTHFFNIFSIVKRSLSAVFFSLLRLYLLVQLFGGVQAAEFSSRLSPGERKKTLKEFEQGKIQLWVCVSVYMRRRKVKEKWFFFVCVYL